MGILHRYALCLAIIGMLLAPSAARAQAELNLHIDRLDTNGFPEIRLFATVTDSQRRALADLGAEHFVLVENGQAVPIASVGNASPEELDLRVALAIDISGSIAPVLEQVKQAAVDFVGTLQPNDQVALILFGNESRQAHDFSTDHGAIIATIQALTPDTLEESTALYNGAFEAVRLTANQATGRRAVVLLTDGKNVLAPGSTSLSLSDVQREATGQAIPLYVIGVGPDVAEQELRLLASSGRYYPVDQPAAVATAYRNIAEQLRQQYEIRYVSQLPPDGQIHELELKVNVPELGAAAASIPLQIEAPEIPVVQLTLPSEITIGEPAALQAHIFSRHPPRTADLLLNGEPVASAPIDAVPWNYTWTPALALDPGTYQLDVRVTDSNGVQSNSEPLAVTLVAPQIPLVRADLPEQITVSRPVTLTADVLARDPPLLIEVLVDRQTVVSDTLTSRAWRYVWTPAGALALGEHQFDLRVTDGAGEQSQSIARTTTFVAPPAGFPWLWLGLGALVLLLGGLGAVLMLRSRRATPGSAPEDMAPAAMLGGAPQPIHAIEPTELAGPARFVTPAGRGDMPDLPSGLLAVERGRAHPGELRLSATREAQLGRHVASDLVLEDARASARHAAIRFHENGFTIVDLGSTNGLRVNGRRVEQMRLQDGDRIEIGDIVLVFKQVR